MEARFIVVCLPEGDPGGKYDLFYGVYDTERGCIVTKWTTEAGAVSSARWREEWEKTRRAVEGGEALPPFEVA